MALYYVNSLPWLRSNTIKRSLCTLVLQSQCFVTWSNKTKNKCKLTLCNQSSVEVRSFFIYQWFMTTRKYQSFSDCCSCLLHCSFKFGDKKQLHSGLIAPSRITSTNDSGNGASTDFSPTVNDMLDICEKRLEKENLQEAKLNSEYIIAQALQVKRSHLKNVMHNAIPSAALEQIETMVNCRLARMPLQYILGDWDFHSITLKLKPPVFVPRPETEELVNISLSLMSEYENPTVLDVCCGSGAISLALLKNHAQMKCVAVDQSKYAVALTQENANDLGLLDRLTIVQGKLTGESFPQLPADKFDLIVSNPPYVLRKDLVGLQPEITIYEDLRALDGGKEGLDVIKPIILLGKQYLKETGSLLMEIDPCHRYLIPNWMEKCDSGLKISSFYKDINGKDRFVKLVWK